MQDDNAVKNDVEVVEIVEEGGEVRQLAADVASATEIFEKCGKPDLEDEHRQRAQELGISDAALSERWKKAKAKWARPKVLGLRGFPARKRVETGNPANDEVGPQIEAAPSVSGEAKPILDEATAKREADLKQDFFDPSTSELLLLNPNTPLDNAKKIITARAWYMPAKIPTLLFWQHEFWEWTGTHWRAVEDDVVRAAMWKNLDRAERDFQGKAIIKFAPKPDHINATMDALRSMVNLSAKDNPMPGWFGANPPDGDRRLLLSCQNGLLHIPTRCLLQPHTPQFWSPNALEFSYEPNARAPRFEQFLEEVWPGDTEAQQCLLEAFGLCLTDITRFHKCFMLVGPPRGGRGTIGRVLRGLIGKENYAGATLKLFSEQFGMEGFIGKKVVVFSDARLEGLQARQLAIITERLLNITGEDAIPINRKNEKYWEGILIARLWVFSNELIRFQEESGALAGRFLTWQMRQSFKGREDEFLTEKLLAERPGILNLAIDALDRLLKQGKLIQCQSGTEMSENLGLLTSDIAAFIEDCCVVDASQEVFVDKLFSDWQFWCAKRNVRHAWGSNQFSSKIQSAVPTIRSGRPRKDNPGRQTKLYGIGIRAKEKR
jgi:putative DNA primase/helicase